MIEAGKQGGATSPSYGNTILASQRYRVQSSGTGIEFDPNDPLYKYVTNQMKAILAFAQQDAGIAQFLSDGLKYDYANFNGLFFPSINSVPVLANFTFPGPTGSVHIPDSSSQNDSHYATAVGSVPGCAGQLVTITETVQQSWTFSPLFATQITTPNTGVAGGWLSVPPAAFKGSSYLPSTPFNGASGSGNPHLVVSVGGKAVNWSNYNFTPANCWGQPNNQCSGTIQIDPIPYAEPGAYYDTNANMVGTQSNPFTIVGTLYATRDHASQWATRTVNGIQEWGTFTTPVTMFGITQYKYAKQM